jgi:hypothetical protein
MEFIPDHCAIFMRLPWGFGRGWAKLNVVFLCWHVRWQNTSFNFAKRWHFRPLFLSVYICSVGRPTLAPNVLGLCVRAEN